MIRSIPRTIWAYDCEWIPDADTGRKVYFLKDNISDEEVYKIMWHKAGATEEDPRPFLKLILSRIVSVSILSRSYTEGEGVSIELFSLPDNHKVIEEKVLIERFLNGIGKKQPQIVGFNSFDADLPIMIQRAIALGVTSPVFSKRPSKPWEGYDYFSKSSEAHLDIKALVAGWGKGSNPSLHELAVASGIPGKLEVDGNQVLDLWLQGKINEIVDYNECDALTTYLVWLRIAHFSGLFNDKQYYAEQVLVYDYLDKSKQEKKHFEKFLKAWEFSK